MCNKPIVAFVYDYHTGDKHYFNFEHKDLPQDITFDKFKKSLSGKCVYVNNKKTYKYWLNCDLYDVNLFGFIKNNEVLTEPENTCKNTFSILHNNLKNFNLIVPYVIHQTIFDEEVEQIKDLSEEKTDNYCYKFFNNVISETLYQVEKNGIKIDCEIYDKFFEARTIDGFVYTDYHIYNPTGRPSNCYDGINYVALKKDDGSRASFVSRYDNGYLLMIDFTGFHPYIVANLIDYKVPDNETIYEHLAKQYYGVDEITPDLLAKSKKLTMVNLYGQIPKQYCDIPYFAAVERLKNEYWKKFESKGYVTTPIYKRKITNKHVIDANKNKLFAYIIQATETEYGIDRLNACLKYVSGKEILPILYNYDAILFDVVL